MGSSQSNIVSVLELQRVIQGTDGKIDKQYVNDFLNSEVVSANITFVDGSGFNQVGKRYSSQKSCHGVTIFKYSKFGSPCVDDFIGLTDVQFEVYKDIKKSSAFDLVDFKNCENSGKNHIVSAITIRDHIKTVSMCGIDKSCI